MHYGEGHPKYSRELLEKLPSVFAEGESIVEACCTLGIHRSIYYQWKEKYPEWNEASSKAEQIAQAYNTKMYRMGSHGKVPGFNAASSTTMMRQFYRKDWAEDKTQANDTQTLLTFVAAKAAEELMKKASDSEE